MLTQRNHRYQKTGLTAQQQDYHVARRRMVEQQVKTVVQDPHVLDAMSKVPRHLFVEKGLWGQAYDDRPLPIGEGQTISQPRIVGLMTQAIQTTKQDRVLEVGTGCGYQTSILCELVREVYSIERIKVLSNTARRHLYDLGYMNFKLRIGDGTLGWPDAGPFDAIIVTAGGPSIPSHFVEQLADGGCLVVPVGSETSQELIRVTRVGDQYHEAHLGPCRFVKLIGQAGW